MVFLVAKVMMKVKSWKTWKANILHTFTSFFCTLFGPSDCTWLTQMCCHFFLRVLNPWETPPSPPLRRHKAWPNWIVTPVLIKFYVRLLLGSRVCSCPAAPQQTMSLRVLASAARIQLKNRTDHKRKGKVGLKNRKK